MQVGWAKPLKSFQPAEESGRGRCHRRLCSCQKRLLFFLLFFFLRFFFSPTDVGSLACGVSEAKRRVCGVRTEPVAATPHLADTRVLDYEEDTGRRRQKKNIKIEKRKGERKMKVSCAR